MTPYQPFDERNRPCPHGADVNTPFPIKDAELPPALNGMWLITSLLTVWLASDMLAGNYHHVEVFVVPSLLVLLATLLLAMVEGFLLLTQNDHPEPFFFKQTLLCAITLLAVRLIADPVAFVL